MIKTIASAVVVGLIVLFGLVGTTHQDAQEILITQSASGALTVYTTPGWHFAPFSKTTYYDRRSSYEFQSPIRFNDGGQATMKGSIQFEIPTDEKTLIDLHSKYGSQDALKTQLVQRVVDKAVFMSGPLMSSRESYAEKKSMLVSDVEDQIARGVYQTRQHEVKTVDPITGAEKTVTNVEIVTDEKGLPRRQEEAVLTPFGIRTFNFTIAEIDYSKDIEAQIASQQKITMDVQTAIATAKQAEQRALTAAKEGEANAAKARWEQEVIKAKAVTAAQQELEVAKLATQKAEQEKQAIILKAEGESEYKRKIITADGALQQKLAAYIEVNKNYANAISAYKGNWVPTTVFGGTTNAGGGAQDLLNLLTAKTAKELSLDTTVSSGK